MAIIIEDKKKNYEKPDSGQFTGIIADVVELKNVQTKFGPKTKIRIVWLLDKNDSEGNPFRVMSQVNASINEKAELYKIVVAVTGAAPLAQPQFDVETLLGRVNVLFVVREKSQDGQSEFANVKAILPAPAGTVAPKIPATFVRHKDRDNNRQQSTQQSTQQSQPAQQQQQAPAQAPAADVAF